MNCKFCNNLMSLVGHIKKGKVKNYLCKCGAHYYSSDRTPASWFSKAEWEEWIEL